MKRAFEPEVLDERPTPAEIASTFRFLAVFNRIGGGRAVLRELGRFSRSWTGPVRILDVASGGADIPRAIAAWAARAGFDVSVTCLELSADILAYARRETAGVPNVSFVRGDARAFPFADGGFDYVIASLFLHHLPDEATVAVLRAFDRLARRGIVVCDLIRRRRAWLWARFLTLFGDPVVRFDGPLSVRRAYTIREIEALAARADLGWARIRPVLGHHFVLSGERPGVRLQSPR
jgi:SAM-dependent methyltransferase